MLIISLSASMSWVDGGHHMTSYVMAWFGRQHTTTAKDDVECLKSGGRRRHMLFFFFCHRFHSVKLQLLDSFYNPHWKHRSNCPVSDYSCKYIEHNWNCDCSGCECTLDEQELLGQWAETGRMYKKCYITLSNQFKSYKQSLGVWWFWLIVYLKPLHGYKHI